MKLFLLAFVALAAAESDPALYTNWYNGYYHTPSVYSTYNSYVPSTFYSGAYSPYVSNYHSIYKREADADHHLPYLYNNPSFYNWSPYMTYRSPVVATTAGQPVFKNGNFHTNLHNVLDGTKAGGVGQVYQTQYKHLIKREADSDSFFPYSSYLPYSGVYHPNVYSSAYTYPYTTTYATNYWNRLYKRDADSDSLLYTTNPYTYTPYSGLYNYNNYYTTPYVNTYSNLYPRYYF